MVAVSELPIDTTTTATEMTQNIFGDGVTVTTRRVGGQVAYVHLMFDRHQIVSSESLATESFLPGPQTTKSFERAIVDEICTLFPEIDPGTGHGYSPAARRVLKHFEAKLLRKPQEVA